MAARASRYISPGNTVGGVGSAMPPACAATATGVLNGTEPGRPRAPGLRASGRRRARHEVDELLDGAHEGGVEVGVRRDLGQQLAPELARRGPNAEAGDDALLPLLAPRHLGPGRDAGGPWAHGLPHVDEP